jgi:Peptidase C65 Otubain
MWLEEAFRKPSGDSMVLFVRYLTGLEMVTHPERYATFLPSLDEFRGCDGAASTAALDGGGSGVGGADALCCTARAVEQRVIAPGVDAEHVMIQALCTALDVALAVVYAVGEAPARVCAVAAASSTLCHGLPAADLEQLATADGSPLSPLTTRKRHQALRHVRWTINIGASEPP